MSNSFCVCHACFPDVNETKWISPLKVEWQCLTTRSELIANELANIKYVANITINIRRNTQDVQESLSLGTKHDIRMKSETNLRDHIDTMEGKSRAIFILFGAPSLPLPLFFSCYSASQFISIADVFDKSFCLEHNLSAWECMCIDARARVCVSCGDRALIRWNMVHIWD